MFFCGYSPFCCIFLRSQKTRERADSVVAPPAVIMTMLGLMRGSGGAVEGSKDHDMRRRTTTYAQSQNCVHITDSLNILFPFKLSNIICTQKLFSVLKMSTFMVYLPFLPWHSGTSPVQLPCSLHIIVWFPWRRKPSRHSKVQLAP